MKKIIYTILVLIALVMLMSESTSFLAQMALTSSAICLLWYSGKRLSDILEKEESHD